MEALKQPTIRVVAIIAEGVPEADAKRLIAYARANNKVLKLPSQVDQSSGQIFMLLARSLLWLPFISPIIIAVFQVAGLAFL
jgi:hypothetical protein